MSIETSDQPCKPLHYTTQEFYDLVVKGALDGLMPSATAYGDCKYRGPEGGKCVIGMAIPDELYKPEFDSVCTLHEIIQYTGLTVDGLGIKELQEAQAVHDDMWNSWNTNRFIQNLNELECFAGVKKHEVVL